MYQAWKGITQSFLEDAKTGEMSPAVRTWYTRTGVIGYLGRAADHFYFNGHRKTLPLSWAAARAPG